MEPRIKPVIIQGELAERMLRATETMVGLKQDVESLKRSDLETTTTLRGTREYDGLVARVRDMERLLKELEGDFSEHRKTCSEEKRERRISRADWWKLWIGIVVSFLLALLGLAQHAPPHTGH